MMVIKEQRKERKGEINMNEDEMIDEERQEIEDVQLEMWHRLLEENGTVTKTGQFLIAEVKRLYDCLRYVGVSIYLDANDYLLKDGKHRPYDYRELLDYIMKITGEPNDLSGHMGEMIREAIE